MTDPAPAPEPSIASQPAGAGAVFRAFLRLGLTSFGGPVAHLGYFRTEFVQRRRWLSESDYAQLVALCQFLPGPASSQVGMAIGLLRAGYAGAAAAWLGFTLPSAIALLLLALGLARLDTAAPAVAGALHGLLVAAVAVVAQAVWGMARTLCPDAPRRALALLAAALALAAPAPWMQLALIGAAALLGAAGLLRTPAGTLGPAPSARRSVPPRHALVWLALFAALLLGLPLAARLTPEPALELIAGFYRVGALVFGGGHVVLPLLQAEVVPAGWMSEAQFLAGYGAAQAVPGPLFTLAAYLGAARGVAPNGWLGATLALLAIFAPAFLLVAGALPFWERLRRSPRAQQVVASVNAAVVGLLLAALVSPVATHGLRSAADVVLGAAALLALMRLKAPPWAVVLACAALGAACAVWAAAR